MGLYYRKRIKLSDNIRINVGRKSSSLSIGKKGSTINFGKRGVYMTFGIPGTGLYFRSKIFSTPKKQKATKQKTPIKAYTYKTNIYKPKKKQMTKPKGYTPMSFAEFIISLIFMASFVSIFISWLIPLFLGMSWIWSIVFLCVNVVFCSFMSKISRKYTSKSAKEMLEIALNESEKQKIGEENGSQEDVLPNKENTSMTPIEDEAEKTAPKQDDTPKTEEPANNDEVNEETVKWLIDDIAKENAGYTNIIPDVRSFDPLFEEAARSVVLTQLGSTAMIQRRFSIGYNRAGRLMDQFEREGIIGPVSGSKPREVLLRNEKELDIVLKRIGKYGYNKDIDEFKELHKSEIEERTQYYINQRKAEQEAEERAYIEAEKARVKQQILENKRKRELRKQALEELKNEGLIENVKKREPIPQEVQDAVWRRDGGRCVKCGSQENLEFDHIIPFSKGGSNTVRNLQLLCEKCNREKSNNIG